MIKPDYTALDAEIIDSIRAGHDKSSMLVSRIGRSISVIGGRRSISVIGGRLQALRIAGKIRVNLRTKRWEVI